jgi:hypothetical protein
MNRKSFTDRRGDEYIFIRYNTNDIKITKKPQLDNGNRQIDISFEAVECLKTFLEEEE